MNAETLNYRFRYFLLLLSGGIFIGTVIELLFSNHMESAVQYIPFVLCAIGLIALIPAVLKPGRATLLTLRLIMLLNMAGGLFGIFEHIKSNVEFSLEIQPSATFSDVFWKSLSGATPLLAPGILTLGAVLALAATYYHPNLTAE